MYPRHPLSLLFAALPAPRPTSPALPIRPVDQLELARYAGTWHEIAHLPMHFQRPLTDHVVATYTLRPDGSIAMHHACRSRRGHVRAVARQAAEGEGVLRVRFALAWLPLAWLDYWIIELDSEYHWAVVGSPNRKCLWVLSRTPSMSPELFGRLRLRAGLRGYPVDRLVTAAGLG
ncbi:lipocalin family protein [Dyella sedimenti]|uniref:lipocalin family protein n=1 Tax=Dyella sedimenti TaxID=2919947 RepID=UPI001FAAC752|nr:lipocalin family protein [Dyella sedimenti]